MIVLVPGVVPAPAYYKEIIMARKSASTAPVEETETVEVEPSTKQLIKAGVDRFAQTAGLTDQKASYKSMRAIAYQAFTEAIEDGTFDKLVDRALDNSGDLPTGYKLERGTPASTPTQVEEAPAKPTRSRKAAATSTEAPAKPARPRRPAR